MIKKRLNIDPESLVPKLPSPQDLKPFPNVKSVEFGDDKMRKSVCRAISVCPSGEFLASGGEDGIVRIFDVQTTKCVREWDMNKVVTNSKLVENEDGIQKNGNRA